MQALTIKQPWASAIMAGVKRVENRTWRTNYRGPLAIHASARVAPQGAEGLAAAGIDPQGFEDAPRGVILGVVDHLIDVIELGPGGTRQQHLPGFSKGRYDIDSDPLATGPYCWVLANPRPLAKPPSCTGQRGLWEVDLGGIFPTKQPPRRICTYLPTSTRWRGVDHGVGARYVALRHVLKGPPRVRLRSERKNRTGAYGMGQLHKPPSRADLEKLSLRAIVAYAVRCVRRVQPLYS